MAYKALFDYIKAYPQLHKGVSVAHVMSLIAQEQAILWERHRKQPEPLPYQQIVALLGKFYRSDIASMEQEPGEATIGEALQKSNDSVSARPEGLEK